MSYVLQATAAFVKFLREAAIFYGLLIAKLQAAYGTVGFQLAFVDQVCALLSVVVLPNFSHTAHAGAR